MYVCVQVFAKISMCVERSGKDLHWALNSGVEGNFTLFMSVIVFVTIVMYNKYVGKSFILEKIDKKWILAMYVFTVTMCQPSLSV